MRGRTSDEASTIRAAAVSSYPAKRVRVTRTACAPLAAFVVGCAILGLAPLDQPECRASSDKETNVMGEIRGGECAALLERICDTCERNFDSVRTWTSTWSGELQLRTPESAETNPDYYIERFQWRTVVDREASAMFAEFDATGPVEVRKHGEKSTRPSGLKSKKYTSVLTPEHFLFSESPVATGTVPGFQHFDEARYLPSSGAVFRREVDRFRRQDTYRIVDPRTLFVSGDAANWAFLRGMARALRNPPNSYDAQEMMYIREESRDGGTHYVFVMKSRPAPDRLGITETEFDSQAGMNQTAWRRIEVGQGIDREWRTEWRKINGCFVPVHATDTLFGSKRTEASSPRAIETFRAGEIAVNEPIDSRVFTLSAFKMQYGDRYYDEIEGQMKIQDSDGLVPAESFVIDLRRIGDRDRGATKSASDPGTSASFVFVAANVMAAAIIAALLWRKYRR
jgi:hypothetical protein